MPINYVIRMFNLIFTDLKKVILHFWILKYILSHFIHKTGDNTQNIFPSK